MNSLISEMEHNYSFLTADFPPDVVANIYCKNQYFVYLKSPRNNKKSELSILGLEANWVLKSNQENQILIHKENKDFIVQKNMFDLLEYLVKNISYEVIQELPFSVGLLGYFSYDCVHYLEKVPKSSKAPFNIEDSIWVLHQLYYIYDHKAKQGYFIYNNKIKSQFERNFDHLKSKIFKVQDDKKEKIKTQFNPSISKNTYLNKMESIKNYIIQGDIYQLNFTYLLESDFEDDPFYFFQRITSEHPMPFSAFCNFPNFQVLSFSPERLIQVRNNNILVQPMKGTRPRGVNPEEDKKLKQDLLTSIKDRAELVMICDLLRNDIGRISSWGSVQVKELFSLEEYPSVFQMTSQIESMLRPGFSLIDIIKSVFPSGSITGCPKIRSMELIHELEAEKRSLFMGSLGYISFHNTLDLNVCIRTLIVQNKKAYYRVGGGIVYDSIAEEEYIETQNKSAFLKNYFDFNWI